MTDGIRMPKNSYCRKADLVEVAEAFRQAGFGVTEVERRARKLVVHIMLTCEVQALSVLRSLMNSSGSREAAA